jgi:hypothetical protein
MKTVTVELLEPRLGGEVTRVVLREPKLSDYMVHGDPVSVASRGGSLYTVENDAAIRGYLAACVVEPDNKAWVDNLGLADAMRVKEALLGFFAAARELSRPAAPSSSPSTLDGAPSPTPAA